MKNIILISIVVVILAGTNAGDVLAGSQAWMANTLKVGVTDKLSVGLCHESRYTESSSFGDPFLDGLQGGLTYKLPAKFYAGILFRRENLQTRSTGYSENRAGLQGGWSPKLFGGIKMSTRLRVESRHFEEPLFEDHIRVRAKIGFSYLAPFGKINIAPFVAAEIFGDDRDHWDTYVNRNRFFLGAKFLLIDHLGFTVNYVRQDTKGFPIVHAFNTGLNLSL